MTDMNYFYGDEAEQFTYFRIPRLLITVPRFKHLSTDAKLLYGMLLDRMGLSMKNGWHDDDGRVYIYYTVEEICDIAPLADKWKAFGWNVIELEDGNDVYAISDAVKAAKANIGSGKPTMVILNTVKGKGISFIEALGVGSHSTNLSAEDVQRALAEIRGE